mgnify:CR=1 FL=1
MEILDITATLVTLAALFGYINHRFLGLPSTIGLMAISLVLSLGVMATELMGLAWFHEARAWVNEIDFHAMLMQGMLSFLLFAGALHVQLSDLAKQKWAISGMATGGVVLSTLLVGSAMWWVFQWLERDMGFAWCLLFGALISPTDPIAVLGILKSAGAPRSLETKITGESLFNDGVGVVVFMVVLGFIGGGHESTESIAWLFVEEALGGIVFGLVIGYVAYRLLRSLDNYQLEVLITLALVMGGYALAQHLHVSGPIAMVVAGLLIGNHGRRLAMSYQTEERLDTFWEMIDEILNAVLFVLIGLELLALSFEARFSYAALLAIPVVLLARFISVGLLLTVLSRFREFSPRLFSIMTWGGLRGGISIALALSLPRGPERDIIIAITYGVVVFSILVQGLTIGRLVGRIR